MGGDELRLKGEEFLTSLNKGNIHNLYLFLGEEYLFEEALKRLKERVIGGEDLFNLCLFFGDELVLQDLIEAIETLPINAQRRVVFLKRIEFLTKDQIGALIRYLNKGIPKSTSLVLSGRLDRGGELYMLILKNGVVVDFWPPFHNEIPAYLDEITKKEGKRLDKDAVTILVDLKGDDLRGLLNEVEKLILYTGKRSIITLKDVLECSGEGGQCSVFDLLEAISERNEKKALQRLRYLLVEGEIPLRILSLLVQELRMIYKAKLLLDEEKDKEEIAHYLNITSKKRLTKILKATSIFDIKRLEEAFDYLLSIDKELKSQDKVFHSLILESLIFKLCGSREGIYPFSYP